MRTQTDATIEKNLEKRVQLAEQRAVQLNEQLNEARARSNLEGSELHKDLERISEEANEAREKNRSIEANLSEMEARAIAAEEQFAKAQVGNIFCVA